MRRAAARVAALILLLPATLAAQQSATVRRARQAYDELNYDSAIAIAQRALRGEPLTRGDLLQSYEVLGFAYASIDSTARAVESFRELILLDPDRDLDVVRVSPRITSLHAVALGQVLVVRRLRADSAEFVVGRGRVPIHFQLSRSAVVRTRVVGPGTDVVVDSQSRAGENLVEWNPAAPGGRPVAPGRYEIRVEAAAGRERFERSVAVTVAPGPVDTVPHLTALEGYAELPEYETPRRNWTPMGVAALYTSLGVGASLALQNQTLRRDPPRELLAVGGVGLAAGFLLSLRRPEPRPVLASILFNRLLREQLARRNEEIARENTARRLEVMLSIVPVREAAR